ncbi:MAG: ParB/RepB/Spo0J family partition protein [Oscillospiraceae bacterium]|nr:ParB/RepB/Spo0J family partition protein [Oscillospiraceae bacterium]
MALGAGLDALFEDNTLQDKEAQTLRMSEIEPNKLQPRKSFDDEALQGLAESIREHGLIQPIIVRPMANSITYQIVAGERRWRACRILGMTEVPVIIREMDDFTASQIAIIENIQRDDLNPVEEAMAYKELTEKYQMTQETISRAMGKSRPYIANAMRLLTLPESVIEKLRDGEITTGHAKALMSIESDDDIISACDEIISNKLNVRQAEKLAQKYNEKSDDNEEITREDKQMKNFFTEMELSLRERLLRKVTIKGNENGKGKITLNFEDKDDLIRLTKCLVMIENGDIDI